MASLLRQLVAGPRSRHPEAGLDLCYVTDNIIATSGPSGTYPQRAYRNPLDQLVKFLDYKHKDDWAIWEFRAEGTGYPDEEVRGKVRHYPWPDHHPPPFKLVPMIMASMRNWLHEEAVVGQEAKPKKERVVVVHCKAGKGRSGTMACSYLISECGWKPEEALARFTERRMRPGFGQGVSIPSQLRWVGYVDRWTHLGKVYVERQIEIMEVHVWGLRNGVKVQVEGFVDEGKTIKQFHVFTKNERVLVEGNTPGGAGFKDMVSDMAGFQNQGKVDVSKNSESLSANKSNPSLLNPESRTSSPEDTGSEIGGGAIVFKPSTRVILPTSDINIDFERRNKASMGWTMVTAVAHVWFNAYFEGRGPENNGNPDENGVFEIEWDKMDGIKGSSRKGTRAFDRLAVVWKAYDPAPSRGGNEEIINEPGLNSPVPQMAAANWKGGDNSTPDDGKDLGLRTESPHGTNISKASSMKSNLDTQREFEGVKPSKCEGAEDLHVDLRTLPHPQSTGSEPTIKDPNLGLDSASATTAQRSVEVPNSASRTDMACPRSNDSEIPTGQLPGGIPEDQMRDAKPHGLGHLQSTKKTIDS